MFQMLAASIIITTTYTFPTLIEQMIGPFNYSSSDASLFGLLYNQVGIFGGIIFAVFLNKNPNFKAASLLFTASTLALYVCM